MPAWAAEVVPTREAARGPGSAANAPASRAVLTRRARVLSDLLPIHLHLSPLTFLQSDVLFTRHSKSSPREWPKVTGLVPKDLIKPCPPGSLALPGAASPFLPPRAIALLGSLTCRHFLGGKGLLRHGGLPQQALWS